MEGSKGDDVPRNKRHEAEPTQPDSNGESKRDAEFRALLDERDSLKDQLLRAYADAQNVRKRVQAEKDAIQRFANESLIHELLPVLDNFERTLESAATGASIESLLDGLRAVDRQLRSVLEARGLVRIAAHGESFDPQVHMAVATEETHELPEGTVTKEVEPGYALSNTVLRPAKVRVAKRP